jgi:hypothetical protein
VASDYRGLKKHIAAVRKRQAIGEQETNESPSDLGTSTRGQLPRSTTTGELDFFFFLQRRPTHERTFDPTERDSGKGVPRDSSKPGLKISRRAEKRKRTRPNSTHQEESQFFTKLDLEVEKVEAFYLDREKEVKEMYDLHIASRYRGFTSDILR